MPIREDLLNPIPGDNPGGKNLRYEPIYDKIKEARREDDTLNQGDWQRERKVADWPAVLKLTQEAIATQSKDIQLAAWLTEALTVREGFAGFLGGMQLIRGLIDGFWDNLFPEIEDGDVELRAAPLSWIGTKLDLRLRAVAITNAGHSYFQYKESRTVGYEKDMSAEQKKVRDKLLKEEKLAPEEFDKGFEETPKAFYKQTEKDLDATLQLLRELDETCQVKFGDDFPSWSATTNALEEIRHVVHSLLEKKRETDPDPPEEIPVDPASVLTEGEAALAASGSVDGIGQGYSFAFSAEAVAAGDPAALIAGAAASLRKKNPASPAPYLLLRGWRWGELRAAVAGSDPMALEAPPTDMRRHLKALALNSKWKELLEEAEKAMSLPCGRAWLDLQRLVVQACNGLGNEYAPLAQAIQSELAALLRDLPQLIHANMMDDSPVANPETQAWLRGILEQQVEPTKPAEINANGDGWPRKPVRAQDRAEAALKAGQEQKAFEIMQQELALRRSGRDRFLCKLALADICLRTNKDAIAQILLDDLAAALEEHKLEAWENSELVVPVLLTLLKSSKKVQGDSSQKQKLFERICRLDPVQALSCSV